MYDLEMLRETGFCHGIENYSRHLSLRDKGETPTTLIDFFPKDFLLVIDESHVTLPQVRGMYNGDHMRKQTLVDYGFRLPSAMDNRPLKFEEFKEKLNQVIYVSATPGDYELSLVDNKCVEQIIRPTGLLDPIIEVKSTKNQIDDIINEINERIKNNERVLITTLTIRMSEELTSYLKELGYKNVAMALTDRSVSIDDEALMSEDKLAIILGTESDGLCQETIDACDYTVKIPMAHGVDSLNVAAASAVAFWQLAKRK